MIYWHANNMLPCVKYERNFVSEEVAVALDFDVITEFWLDLKGWLEEVSSQLADEKTRQILGLDEGRFMERASMRAFVAEVCASEESQLLGNKARRNKARAII